MAKVEDCPGFETFGADVKAARKAKHLTRKVLAEIVGIEWRYLANIENEDRGRFLVFACHTPCSIPLYIYSYRNSTLVPKKENRPRNRERRISIN